MEKQPIGIFDSGVGGTSIWREIQQLLPLEDTLYLSDSHNAPYGEKSRDEILRLSIKNTEFLLEHNCKIIVVACNTATTNAISFLRNTYKVPFIGIEPAIKPAAINSKSKIVGVLATKGTLTSSLFHSTAKNHAAGIKIVEQQGSGLVELIEKGALESEAMDITLRQYLEPMLKDGIDYLVLGCTHYPYLIPAIKKIVPNTVKIIDSGEAVAKQVKSILLGNKLLVGDGVNGNYQFYTNGDVGVLKHFVQNTDLKVCVDFLDF